jgi:hypothetical protein
MSTTTNKTVYLVVSKVWMGGGVQSRHRTLQGAERAIKKADSAVRSLNRNGGTAYHDCRIVTR